MEGTEDFLDGDDTLEGCSAQAAKPGRRSGSNASKRRAQAFRLGLVSAVQLVHNTFLLGGGCSNCSYQCCGKTVMGVLMCTTVVVVSQMDL